MNRFLRPETRYARRMARIARWGRPIDGRPAGCAPGPTCFSPITACSGSSTSTSHRVSDRLWRSAQPAPHQLAWYKAQGVRTVVNLRGGREHGSWQLQKEACDRLGLTLVDFVVRSRAAPDRRVDSRRQGLLRRRSTIRRCCTASRAPTGPASSPRSTSSSTRAGRSEEALRQLSLRYGHFRFAKTGILDAFFERYREEGEAQGVAFLDWVERIYDPDALEREFRPRFWSDFIVDRIMRRE